MPTPFQNVQLRLPPDLLEQVDRAVRWAADGGAPISRNALVARLLRESLTDLELLGPADWAKRVREVRR